ncbi:GFA family protein [Sphingomonas sp. S2-65]|uniref:GFA family protein n=1 Tax=Sphingomonas sp. S2-65 TaxID=2903960 RepID=UPI0021BC613E|nr:GFA family protein [Sphingomonas sp. S2-65]UYY58106.1 GFA family protein [Sphingomonas sp. S2-65]
MVYHGRCQCGAVRAEIRGEPAAVRECWCRQCQQLAAGGPTRNAMFRTEDVELSGELSTFAYVAASGNTLLQSYCGVCGTPVMAQSSARPQFRTIRLGFLDVLGSVRPTMAIWTEEAPYWALIDPDLEQHTRQPPPPPATS